MTEYFCQPEIEVEKIDNLAKLELEKIKLRELGLAKIG